MKIVKIILSIIVILFAILGLLKTLPFDITQPIMLFALATLILLQGIELKKNKDNVRFGFMLASALFVYSVIIYNVFIG